LSHVEEPSSEDLDRILAGDQEAFAAIYRRYKALVFGVARSILGPSPTAEEAVQETFLRVHRSLGTFQRGTRFGAWVTTIARNTSLTLHKRGGPVQVPLDDAIPAPPFVPASQIEELLVPLSVEERLVVLMRYVQGLSYEEMSPVLDRAAGTLRNVMSQALRKLRTHGEVSKEGAL
jgi:RNA polymerase sigma-70 factor (ECF subfamily)